MTVCAQLALRHGHEASGSLLERVWEDQSKSNKIALIDSLTFVETSLSLGFLEMVAKTDARSHQERLHVMSRGRHRSTPP